MFWHQRHGLEEAERHATDLYWLAFLLTGHHEKSADLAIEVIESAEGDGTFFSGWMKAWSRRLVIARALATVQLELNASKQRTRVARTESAWLPAHGWNHKSWVPDSKAPRAQLEQALLAIDIFPRCVVALSVFEGIKAKDAAILLDADLGLIRKAQAVGLREVVRNLTVDKSPTKPPGAWMTQEVQHA